MPGVTGVRTVTRVAAFVAAVRGDAPRPAVTGAEAARSLAVALAVEQAASA